MFRKWFESLLEEIIEGNLGKALKRIDNLILLIVHMCDTYNLDYCTGVFLLIVKIPLCTYTPETIEHAFSEYQKYMHCGDKLRSG